jgi:23S rRNA (uracil1939-C5)-methyltransferase
MRGAPAADAVFMTRIEGIAAGGAGLGRRGGKSVFIPGSAAGDLAACRIVEERRSWARAELLEIVEASPDRTSPVCGCYGVCGGCNLQHLRYEAQLAAKAAIVQDACARIGGFVPPPPAFVSANPFEYRNRMQFHRIKSAGGGSGTAGFGLKARNSAEVIPVPDCPVADPGIREALRKTSRGEAALPMPPEKDRFTVYARDGLFLGEGGKRRGRTRLLGRDIVIDAGVFFQSNGALLEKLIADLRETAAGVKAADRSLPMADLYCGVGTFAAFIGDLFPRADLVEENKTALSLARENVRNTETNLFALRDGDWARAGRGGRYGFIVADPPRQGLAPALAEWLAADGPATLAYVSCDPAALARDSAILTSGVYGLAELRCYDFYPQTAHIESLAIFVRN